MELAGKMLKAKVKDVSNLSPSPFKFFFSKAFFVASTVPVSTGRGCARGCMVPSAGFVWGVEPPGVVPTRRSGGPL